MAKLTALARSEPDVETDAVYPSDLQPAIQEALSILADIDCRYGHEREQLEFWDGPDAVKERLAEQIEQRYRLDRQPYLEHLSALQQRMMERIGLRFMN